MPDKGSATGRKAARIIKRTTESTANGTYTASNFVALNDRCIRGDVGVGHEGFRSTFQMTTCNLLTKATSAFALLISLSGLTGAQNCYTVYSTSNEIIYQSRIAPVAMNVPSIGVALEKRFPGGSMVFNNSAICEEVNPETIAKQKADQKEELARKKAAVLGPVGTQQRLVEQNSSNLRPANGQKLANTPAYTSTRGFSTIAHYEAARSICMRLMSQHDFTAPIMRCGLNDSNCFRRANQESNGIFQRMIALPEWRQQQCDLVMEIETAANNDESGCTQVQIMRPVPFLGTAEEVVFLSDGSVWKDLSYKYLYLYLYNPSVLICPAQSKMILDVGSQKHTFTLMRVR